MSNYIPSGSQALRLFADTLDQQADRLDRLFVWDRGQGSTTEQGYRTSATAAQPARRWSPCQEPRSRRSPAARAASSRALRGA